MNRRMLLSLVASAALLPAMPALAQGDFPNKPIRIVVPYNPGGATDIAARIVAERMRHTLGQSVIVLNKPGAFGILAIEEMLRAEPDGYTLMAGNPSTNVITPIVHASKLKSDYAKEVTLLARLVELPSFILATTTDFPPNSVPEWIEYAKKNPGKVRYASAGIGSFPHYSMAVYAQQAGIDMLHVPVKGGGSAMLQDVMKGDVHVTTMNAATAGPLVGTGKVKVLAASYGSRIPGFPDIPAVSEFGLTRPGSGFWQALFAPSATPKPVLEKLHKAVLEALEHPDVIKALDGNKMERIPHKTLAEGQEWLKKEAEEWREVTKKVPIQFN